jgi:hypothetical protein
MTATRRTAEVKRTTKDKGVPEIKEDIKALPESKTNQKELPKVGHPENTIVVGEDLIEIKPTLLRYQRNRTASFYRALELYSVAEILTWEPENLGDERDGDQALMEWLIAVFDNEEFVKKHYDEMDSEMIEKILEIFKRVNHIKEKEEERLKNVQAGKTKA